MNKFIFYNDTQKNINIHPATETHGTNCDMSTIKPFEQRVFELPVDTYPLIKQWSNGTILVSPTKDDVSDNNVPKHIGKYPIDFSFTNLATGRKIVEFCDNIEANDLYISMMLKMIKEQALNYLNKENINEK